MKKFQEKSKWKNILQSKPFLIILGFIVLGLIWSVFGLFNRMQETAKNRKIEEDKILDLRQRKEKLIFDINNLKTEKGVEENIREKFGLVKEGEEMIVVVEEKTQTESDQKKSMNKFLFFLKNIFSAN
jgi:cell division protein FtsB